MPPKNMKIKMKNVTQAKTSINKGLFAPAQKEKKFIPLTTKLSSHHRTRSQQKMSMFNADLFEDNQRIQEIDRKSSTINNLAFSVKLREMFLEKP